MDSFPRRSFPSASSGAAAGTLLVPGLLETGEPQSLHFAQSGLVTGQPKAFKRQKTPGFLSAEQIAPHPTAHYGEALKAVIAADAKLEESTKSGTAIDPAAFAHLKRLINSRAK